jgi:hypothetical protein
MSSNVTNIDRDRDENIQKKSKRRNSQSYISAANRIGFLDAYSLVKLNLRLQVVILLYHRVEP